MREAAVRRKTMGLESILGLAVSILLLFYLVYALLNPERF
jgi:K+-transporting ATPase KdpF subunit